jgi:hypothetical protein
MPTISSVRSALRSLYSEHAVRRLPPHLTARDAPQRVVRYSAFKMRSCVTRLPIFCLIMPTRFSVLQTSVLQTSFGSMAPRPATAVETGLPQVVLCAAHEGSAHGAVAAWLDEGGGVDARCAEQNRNTLLMMAALGGQEATVRMLLQRSASVNLQSSYGVTSLMYAALKGHTTIAQALLDAKAGASLQDTDGRTALMIAEHYKHTAVAKLLRQHARRQTAEAEARAAASAVHAAAAADAMAAELLGEEAAEKEAVEKEAAAKKGKKKKAKPPPKSTATGASGSAESVS